MQSLYISQYSFVRLIFKISFYKQRAFFMFKLITVKIYAIYSECLLVNYIYSIIQFDLYNIFFCITKNITNI